jgi:hypothetical protein
MRHRHFQHNSRRHRASSPVLRTRPGENGPARCSLVAVNDSFMHQPGFLLQEGGVFRSVEVNSYFYMERRRFPDWTPGQSLELRAGYSPCL